MLPEWAWYKFYFIGVRKTFIVYVDQDIFIWILYETKILYREIDLLIFHQKYLQVYFHPVVGDTVYLWLNVLEFSIVKFVKTAMHYYPYLLKNGYDNVFNFQSLKCSTAILFMMKFIQQIYLFLLGKIQRTDNFPPLWYLSFLDFLRNLNT